MNPWTGTAAASCNHARMLASVKVPVLLTHHFRKVDDASGDLLGALSDTQAARVRALIESAGGIVDYQSFPTMGHSDARPGSSALRGHAHALGCDASQIGNVSPALHRCVAPCWCRRVPSVLPPDAVLGSTGPRSLATFRHPTRIHQSQLTYLMKLM